MKNQHIKILLLILVVFGGLWVGQTVLNRRTQSQNSTEGKLDLPAKASEVKRIEINFSDKSVVVQKRDNIWFVQSLDKPLGEDRAKEDDVNSLLKILEPTDIKLVSINQNSHKDLGLEATGSASIKFFIEPEATEAKVTLLVSKQNPKLFRQNDMTNVYEWSGDLSRIVRQDLTTWIAPTSTPTVAPEASNSPEVKK